MVVYSGFKSKVTTNTTPAKPREGTFGSTWFVCDLKFEGWSSKSGPKSNTHCESYIVDELTADHIARKAGVLWSAIPELFS